jgi:galactose mutarotase-like enzyme
MAKQTWILTDVERELYRERGRMTGQDGQRQYSVQKRTLRGGLRDGVDVVEVDNGLLRFTVVPTRGMGLWRAWLGDMTIGWQSPVNGPVHPQFVPVDAPNGIGWLSGFDELVCRCGLESNGAPQFDASGQLLYPLHGRIANLPAHRVEVSTDPETKAISVTGVVDEARLFCNKLRLTSTIETVIGQPWLRIVDEVTNLWGEPSELELLYHINMGHPLLSPGARIVAPIKTLVPRDPHSASDVRTWSTYAPAQAGKQEFAHFLELAADSNGRTRALLELADGERGVSLEFNRRQLPTFTLWKSERLPTDGYVTGLEPGINLPNIKAFEKERGRVAVLAPGETRRFEIKLAVHADPDSLATAKHDIAELARGVEPRIFDRPQPGWSPAGG